MGTLKKRHPIDPGYALLAIMYALGVLFLVYGVTVLWAKG